MPGWGFYFFLDDFRKLIITKLLHCLEEPGELTTLSRAVELTTLSHAVTDLFKRLLYFIPSSG